ncbi:MAG: hypothetical protein NXH82_05055 [Rhodobacteraceae bacterium]|nr:hypothetical protein [Paracoccaceae bacterium]
MSDDTSQVKSEAPKEVPKDFVYDTEHPVLPIPFTATLGEKKLKGVGISVAAAYASAGDAFDPDIVGSRHVTKLQFDFKGFSITIFPEVSVEGIRDGELTLQFMDPAGPHLPQLRYILNSFIAGDFVSLGSMLSYTGPTTPGDAKSGGQQKQNRFNARRIGTLLASFVLIGAAFYTIYQRYTVSYEQRPVFILRAGNDMRATSGGQISFLNPTARQGEVIYSISANTGDVLNFKNPCNCEVSVNKEIYEGATVLPSDPILTLFDSNFDIRVQTHMSVEGLTKAMNGDRIYLEMNDGRSVPAELVVTTSTSAAARAGELFVPVELDTQDGALTADDIGEPARVRLSRSLPWIM